MPDQQNILDCFSPVSIARRLNLKPEQSLVIRRCKSTRLATELIHSFGVPNRQHVLQVFVGTRNDMT